MTSDTPSCPGEEAPGRTRLLAYQADRAARLRFVLRRLWFAARAGPGGVLPGGGAAPLRLDEAFLEGMDRVARALVQDLARSGPRGRRPAIALLHEAYREALRGG
jgi:hypothetical protein